MVFSSLPFYLDPPPNWQHQQQHQQGNNGDPQLPPLPPPPHGGVSGGIRPGSMAGARLAKIPLPEPAQKCPRCDSTNTKFCYFNNYSLSQPRHFCKACRRYWTRGGALRNVPVGGGCRRNKKTKNNSSKSSSSTAAPSPNSSSEISGSLPQQTPHFPFLTSLPNFSQFGNVGLNFPGIHAHLGGGGGAVAPTTQADLGFQVTNQHQQQFPFFENPTSMYPFPGTTEGPGSSRYAIQSSDDTAEEAARVSEMAPMKTERSNNNLLNLSNPSRPMLLGVFDNSISDPKTGQSGLMGVTEMSTHNNDSNQHQFWGGNNWGASDLSGTNHLLH